MEFKLTWIRPQRARGSRVGRAKNNWTDIKNADAVLIMGGNAAGAHPCGFKWVTEAKRHKGEARRRFYCPIRPGTDTACLLGGINYLLTEDQIHHDCVANYTNASFIVNEGWTAAACPASTTCSPRAPIPATTIMPTLSLGSTSTIRTLSKNCL